MAKYSGIATIELQNAVKKLTEHFLEQVNKSLYPYKGARRDRYNELTAKAGKTDFI